jgi:competence protein ComEC
VNPSSSAPSAFSRYPLVPAAIAFALGVGVERLFDLPILSLLAALISCLVVALVTRRRTRAEIPLFAAFAILGAFCFCIEQNSIRSDRIRSLIDTGQVASGDPMKATGIIRGGLEPTADGFVTLLDVERVKYRDQEFAASGRVRFYVSVDGRDAAQDYDQLDLHDGSRITVSTNLFREEAYLNPGVMSRIESLDRQGIDATGMVKSPLLIEKLDGDLTLAPLVWLRERRQDLIAEFVTLFEPSTAGTLVASLLGDKFFLDKQTADLYREGGTFHVLVISGLHITFIGGLILLFVRRFTRRRILEFAVVTSALWTYTLLVGAEVPVVRASLMFTILLFSGVIDRERNLLNSFAACTILLLVWRPSDLFDPSFQLTFASVGAIVVTAFPLIEKLRKIGSWTPDAAQPFPPNVPPRLKRFCETLYWREDVWRIEMSRQVWKARIIKLPYLHWPSIVDLRKAAVYLFEVLLVSAVVQLWLLPFTIVYFHRITPASVFLNLWVGFFIAVESFSALAAVGVAHISHWLAVPFINLTEVTNSALLLAPKLFGYFEWSSWRVPIYSGSQWIYGVYFLLVISLGASASFWDPFRITRKSGRLLNAAKFTVPSAVLLLAGVIVFHPFSAPRGDGRLHVDFLDVGQGDSALITFPNGQTMLVDGGGKREFRSGDDDTTFEADRPRIGERVVSEYLWEKGYSRVDYIAATHADADHIQGLADVAANFDVGMALFARMPANDPNFAALDAVLEKRSIPKGLLDSGQSMEIAGVTIDALWPDYDTSPNLASDNNSSLVLRLQFGVRTILMTGDIEQPAEAQLLRSPELLRADLIKVAHHGSRTSSTQPFVNAVKPEFAMISVGRRSPFGHPHREVVERWFLSGAKVLTTGERGTISASTDGVDLLVRQYLGESGPE